MKILAIEKPGVVDLKEIDEPLPGLGWARVRVRAAAICMTDFEVLDGRIAATYPLVPGHEWSGVVDDAGSHGDRAWIGRRVVGDNEITCLECARCRAGEWRRCAQYRQIGFQAPGACAEAMLVPVRNLHEIPPNISFEQAALIEPLAVGLAVAAMAEARPGATAVVLGAGPIGLNCLAALKAAGAARALCLDRRGFRLRMASRMGASDTFADPDALRRSLAASDQGGADIVVDATGDGAMLRLALSLSRFGGTVVLAGYAAGRSVPIDPDAIHERNLRVLGAGNNSGFTAAALRCVASGVLRTDHMITHRYALDDYRKAFSRAAAAAPDYIKGVFVFDP